MSFAGSAEGRPLSAWFGTFCSERRRKEAAWHLITSDSLCTISSQVASVHLAYTMLASGKEIGRPRSLTLPAEGLCSDTFKVQRRGQLSILSLDRRLCPPGRIPPAVPSNGLCQSCCICTSAARIILQSALQFWQAPPPAGPAAGSGKAAQLGRTTSKPR